MTEQSKTKYLVIGALAVALTVFAYDFLTTPEHRTPAEKISDAVNEVPKATRQLEDRTPVEKLGDAAEDAGDDIRKATR